MTHRPPRARPLALLLLATVSLSVPLAAAPEAGLAKKRPKTTKIKHVGSFEEMPNSQVSFTLVKRGGKLVKAVDVRVSGVELFCSDGNGNHSTLAYSTTYPDMRIGRALGVTGFAVTDLPMREFEWGFKSFAAFLGGRGMRAEGDARIRWNEGEGGCGGRVVTWTSRAR